LDAIEGVRFVNSALKIQCHIKNTLLQTAFSAILRLGWMCLFFLLYNKKEIVDLPSSLT